MAYTQNRGEAIKGFQIIVSNKLIKLLVQSNSLVIKMYNEIFVHDQICFDAQR